MPNYQQPPRFVPQAASSNNVAPRPTFPPKALPAPDTADKSIRSKYVNYVNRPQFSPNNSFQRKPFSQNSRSQFSPAIPPRTAQITELRNIEQEYNHFYDPNSYYEDLSTNSYQYPENYQEAPYFKEQQSDPSYSYQSETSEDGNREEPVNDQEPMDYLNFQLATDLNIHR